MNKSTIIKLREIEADREADQLNGNYTIKMSQNVLLEEGDQVSVKSVFLDTRAETVVSVPEDIIVEMDVAKYVWNYYVASDATVANPFRELQAAYSKDGAGTSTPLLADMRKYWCCRLVPATGQGSFILTSTLLKPIKSYKKVKKLTFQLSCYVPGKTNGERTTITLTCPGFKYHDHTQGFTLPVNRFVGTFNGQTDIKVVPFPAGTKDDFSEANFFPDMDGNKINTLSDQNFAELITQTCSIPIPASNYQPSELAQILTDGMSLLDQDKADGTPGSIGNDYSTGVYTVNSPFMTSTQQMYDLELRDGLNLPVPADNNATLVWIAEFDKNAVSTSGIPSVLSQWGRLITGPADDNLVGTNQASLNFDPVLNKMNFDIIHMPVFVPTTGTAYAPGIVYPPVAATVQEPITAYSGVGFTDLRPATFWDSLGFTAENHITQEASPETVLFNAGSFIATPGGQTALQPASGREMLPVRITTQPGKNITQQYAGMDLVVQKEATWRNPSVPNTTGILTSKTVPIIADRQFNTSSVDDGFYLVNIGIKFPQKMIGSQGANETGSNTLQSIVGKYFTQNNFLQDSGSGSITYTHVGEPQLINELSVRITNGDGTQPRNTDIGDNNSIFVEIIKPATQN